MEHVVAIASILAWPVTLLIGLIILRKPIRSFIPQLKKLKYKALELEFEKNLAVLSQKSETSLKSLEITQNLQADFDSYIKKVTEASPRAAIIESWLSLEAATISAAQTLQPGTSSESDFKNSGFTSALRLLEKRSVLDEKEVDNLYQIRKLRNQALHEVDFHITDRDAKKFIDIIQAQTELMATISKIEPTSRAAIRKRN